MSEHYFEVDIRTILDDYVRRRIGDNDVLRLPMTGQPVYDEWIDTEKNKVLFRVYDPPEEHDKVEVLPYDSEEWTAATV